MILGLQITGVVFSLIMIYFAAIHYKKGTLSGLEMFSWLIIWSVVIVVCIFPAVFRLYSEAIAVSRLLDLLIAGAFVVVIVMVATTYVRTKKMERKLEELIRKQALQKR